MGTKSGLHQRQYRHQLDAPASLPVGKPRQIFEHLQAAIVEHRLVPGAKLPEDELCAFFGVSRTQVRSALHALAHSGLLTIERHRGAFVAKPSPSEATEVFEARALIEPHIAGLAARRATADDIGYLRDHVRTEHEALAAGDISKSLSLSGRFHIAIADIAGHELLGEFVRSLVSKSSLIIALYWRNRDTTCESHSHTALIDAFEAQDVTRAADIMKDHIVELRDGLDLTERNAPTTSLAELLSSVESATQLQSE
ncbi:MAG: GntR family transcriptional regulator [Pseudomonadota bacterium]